MGDQLNVGLQDEELLSEIEMTSNLMIVAAQVDDLVAQHAIDAALGLEPDRRPPGERRCKGAG